MLEDWGCLSRAGAVPVLATVGAMGNAESTEIVDEDGAIQSEPESGSVLLKLRKIRDRIGDHVSEIGRSWLKGMQQYHRRHFAQKPVMRKTAAVPVNRHTRGLPTG